MAGRSKKELIHRISVTNFLKVLLLLLDSGRAGIGECKNRAS